ncbi:MAG TPA: anaerobic ribonucleoside-triphosphate reductase [Bacilli bacterium]|nr:anaerobic ribonucleoside-triphosphate reductase [Bacilli bacterium]
MKNSISDLVVVKRSGQRVLFDGTKIAVAIKKGFDSVYEEYDPKNVNTVYEVVLSYITKEYSDRKTINVEDIQDIIENKLKKCNFDEVYKSYSEYRNRRKASRDVFAIKHQHKFVKTIEELGFDKEDPTVQTAIDTMLNFGYTVSKEFGKVYLLDNKYTKALEDGYIYIDDISFLSVATTKSCQLDLKYINQSQGIKDYLNNIVNIIENNRYDQHGEQGIPDFDYLLEPILLYDFKKKFINKIYDYFDLEGLIEFINFQKIKESINNISSIEECKDFISKYQNNKRIICILEHAYSKTLKYIEEELYNGLLKFITDLNNSNFGINIDNKITSINMGTNTSFEGKMIIKNYLEAFKSLKNIDNVVTIFKIKDDINYNKGTINNDLLLESYKIPNITYSFLSSKVNQNKNVNYFSDGTRIFENIYDDKETSIGRGVISKTTINLARLGLKYKGASIAEFYTELGELMELVKNQLLQRFDMCCNKDKEIFKCMFKNNLYIDSDKLEVGQKIRKVFKHGVLCIGISGLEECVQALGIENEDMKILKFLKQKCDSYTNELRLNFKLSGVVKPYISKQFIDIDKSIYGIVDKVTDKDNYNYIVNERYHKELSGGHIFIVKSKDISKAVDDMHEKDIGYGKIT